MVIARKKWGLEEEIHWSGRWELNPRRSAWEADILPLNYARPEESPVLFCILYFLNHPFHDRSANLIQAEYFVKAFLVLIAP
jgi:hypothetical protein